MPDLSDLQVEIIHQQIKEQSIKTFAFSDELLDYVCCRAEKLMAEGMTFEEAQSKLSHLYRKKQIKKINRNFQVIFNISNFLNTFIIYASLLLYLCSWALQIGQSDWMGLAAFLLICILHFRYSILFKSDRKLKLNNTLSLLSGASAAILLTGSIFRFMWLNYGFSSKHIAASLLFAWLIISLTNLLYLKKISQTRSRGALLVIASTQLILSAGCFLTFTEPLHRYIAHYATLIIVINILSFFALFLIRNKAKSYLRLLILTSSLIVFMYVPHKAIINNENYKVQFKTHAPEAYSESQLFLYLNYFKYGKEMLVLHKENDSTFKSDIIEFTGGNLNISYTVLKDSMDLHKTINNRDFAKHELILEKTDTIFALKYYQN